MGLIKNIANKYNKVCKDTNTFVHDARERGKQKLNDNIEYTKVKKEMFKQKLQLLIENTKMNAIERLVKGDDYTITLLQLISAIMSTIGIAIKNSWIEIAKDGLKMNIDLISGYLPSKDLITLIIVCTVFYQIQNKAYKHFKNTPTLFSSFDLSVDRRKQKFINIASVIIVFIAFIFSMITNVIAFRSFGADWSSSLFCGVGVDAMSILSIWYYNKFTTLDGYSNNSDSTLIESDITNTDVNTMTAREQIDNIINNTPVGERIKYTYNEMFSSAQFYKVIKGRDDIEKRGRHYYKKEVV